MLLFTNLCFTRFTCKKALAESEFGQMTCWFVPDCLFKEGQCSQLLFMIQDFFVSIEETSPRVLDSCDELT